MKPVACNVCVPNGAKSGGCAAAPSGVDASSLLLPLGLAALVPLALRRRRPRR
jgi:MYXO-CTERM domain-containing protein